MKLSLYNIFFSNVPKSCEKEFFRECTSRNLWREFFFDAIITVWHILMIIYLWPRNGQTLWHRLPTYKYLFVLHIIALVYYSINGIMLNRKVRKKLRFKNRTEKILEIGFILFTFQWCAVSVAFTASQLTSYTIGTLALAATLVMRARTRFILLGSGYVTLCLGAYFINNSFIIKEQYIINGAILTICSLIASTLIYKSFVRDFTNRKIIKEKSEQLEATQKTLEDIVDRRTQELMVANEQIINEINMRHQVELQAYKTKLQSEEQARLLMEVKEYDKLRGEFFTNISHELRTPLNIIFCTAQVLRKYFDDDTIVENSEKTKKHIGAIMQNCNRLTKLVNNLIDITKIDAGYIKLQLVDIDIVGLVREIVLSVTQYFESLHISLMFDTDIPKKVIACDPDKIERIMLNILSNACKFTKSNGEVSVNIQDKQDYLEIRIKDNGIGIPADKLKIIFEKFQQVDKSYNKPEGSGIGLSLVKSLIEMHGGSVTVVSEINKGSEFIIELPSTLVNVDAKDCIARPIQNRLQIMNIEFSDIYNTYQQEAEQVEYSG